MKLRNIFSIILSSALFFAGCVEEMATGSFENISLDKTYLYIPSEGGSVSVELKATESWAFVAEGWPEWLSQASQMSGEAGEYTISFSAAAAEANNEANLEIKAGSRTQRLRITQQSAAGSGELELSTCADVIAGPDSKTFRVKGTCTAIANTEYGNWYLDDGTGSIYIYGTLDANGGSKNFLSLGIEQGDVVEVKGPKLTYGTVVELVDVEVLSITKSLVKVETESATYPKEANEFDVKVSFKGESLSPSVPTEYRSWVSIASYKVVKGEATNAQPNPADTAVVTVGLLPNTGGDRSGSIDFTLGETKVTYDFMQEGEILECSIAEFNAAPKGDTQYRITGVVSSVANADKGRFYIKDYSGETYVYNMSGFADTGIKADDIVVLVGKHDEYNGVSELVSAYVEKVYPVTTVTPTEFLTKADAKDVYYKVSGTITSIANETYGNCYVTDGTSELYVYGVYPGVYPGLNATGDTRKNFMATAGIEAGDVISVIGYKATYNGVIELCGGIYVSHEKGVAPEPEPEPEPEPGSEYSINLAYTLGSNAYDDGVATVNGEENDVKVLKIGTSSKAGSIDFTVPAGTKKVSFYAVAWKNAATTLTFSIGGSVVAEQEIAANDGATNNSPYTLTIAETDKYTLDCSALTGETVITVSTKEGAKTRAILFGIK